MKKHRGLAFTLCLLALVFVSAEDGSGRDVIHQVSVINALMAGGYDGEVEIGELKKRGDFGIGTFHALDGEMVVLDGVVYQVGTDGVARAMDDDKTTPFATVTFFDADKTIEVSAKDLAGLKALLDKSIESKNLFQAIRIEGEFSYVKVRSVPAQNKPYPSLPEVIKSQSVFELKDVWGTVVGFRCPDYVSGVNLPGYHFHFLTEDKKAGGHVLEISVKSARAAIDDSAELFLDLPEDEGFNRLDLGGNKKPKLE